MRNCDIKFVNKEITPFGGLSLFFKMLDKCHFEEHVIPQFGITERLIQHKCSVHTPASHAIRSG